MRPADFALAWWWVGDMTPVADLHGYRGVCSVVRGYSFDERRGGVQGYTMDRSRSWKTQMVCIINLLKPFRVCVVLDVLFVHGHERSHPGCPAVSLTVLRPTHIPRKKYNCPEAGLQSGPTAAKNTHASHT